MTTQEKLYAVEKAIRKTSSRLLRDSVGCKYKDNNIEFTLVGFDDVDEVWVFQFKDENGKKRIKCVNRHYFQIIGHDILLSDVLEWSSKTFKNFRKLLIDDDGIFYKFLINGMFDDAGGIRWDLSKPYLKDQSEELIDFLYDFLEKE